MVKRILWIFAIVSLIASIPLINDRYVSETSTKRVEVIVEYAEISKVVQRVGETVSEAEIIQRLKGAGVTSVAFNELTLNDLATEGSIYLYDAAAFKALSTIYRPFPDASSLILFAESLEEEERVVYEEMILRAFGRDAEPYVWDGRPGILVHRSPYTIDRTLLGLDFNVMKRVKDRYGLETVARIQTSRIWNEEMLTWQFEQLAQLGVQKIVFDGKEVLGYPSTERMQRVAEWMNRYQMSFGIIEFFKQSGSTSLAKLVDLRSLRLLSISGRDTGTNTIEKTADTFALGITERNIRMIYVHLPIEDYYDTPFILDRTTGVVTATKEKIAAQGYVYGVSKPFFNQSIKERGWYNLIIIVGSLALTTILVDKYWTPLRYLPIPLGLLAFAAGQFMGREILIYQMVALLTAIVAPTLATILTIEWIQRASSLRSRNAVLVSIAFFLGASIISFYGAVSVVSLLNDLIFVKYLDQFRGVKLLYVVPMVLVALYLLKQSKLSVHALMERTVTVWNKPIQVKHIAISVFLIGIIGYYLSRSGNEAVTLPFELQFREALNDLFGIRPRTKEIFLGHPLFILASYFLWKYRRGSLLFVGGVIGQLSMVSTFTHLHSPLAISALRTLYGMGVGIAFALFAIVLWEIGIRIWSRRGVLKQ